MQYTVSTAAASSGGALAKPWVGQFRAAAGGTGTGYFQAGASASTGSNTTLMLTGDIDGDGDLDVLTTSVNSYYVSILRNTGGGSFSYYSYFFLGPLAPYTYLLGCAFGDVDGDGDLDLVTSVVNPASASAGEIRLFSNNGTGTFGPPQSMPMGGAGELVLGDVGGDGDLDATVSTDTQLSIRLNDGAGNFSSGQNLPMFARYKLAMSDLDNDGDLDLAALYPYFSYGPVYMALYANNGDGVFTQGPFVAITSQVVNSLTLADMNGDNYPDIVLTDNYGDITLQRNTGNLQFGASTGLNPGGNVTNGTVGDVDSDGDLDVLTAVNLAAPFAVKVALNDGAGNLSRGQTLPVSGPGGLALADIDGDGDLDVLASTAISLATHGSTSSYGQLDVRLNGAVLAATAAQATPAATLYPNPAPGAITLTGATPRAAVEVRNTLGAAVYCTTANAGGTAALPAGLAPGLYVVHAGEQVLRLVVE